MSAYVSEVAAQRSALNLLLVIIFISEQSRPSPLPPASMLPVLLLPEVSRLSGSRKFFFRCLIAAKSGFVWGQSSIRRAVGCGPGVGRVKGCPIGVAWRVIAVEYNPKGKRMWVRGTRRIVEHERRGHVIEVNIFWPANKVNVCM